MLLILKNLIGNVEPGTWNLTEASGMASHMKDLNGYYTRLVHEMNGEHEECVDRVQTVNIKHQTTWRPDNLSTC